MSDPSRSAIVVFVLYLALIFFRAFPLRQLIRYFNSITPSGRKKLSEKYKLILEPHSAYFSNLSEEGKKIFISRVILLLWSKEFIGMEGLTVTEEMKIKLAAAAVQITFGFKQFSLSHFHTFKIFPGTFYSRMHNRYLKGGTSTGGVMFFSWEDFVEGYKNSTDKYNLGLHEMAHALRIQLLHGSDFDDRFANYTDQWEELARPEFEAMSTNPSPFLRSYASVNMEEFFAVCVEHFFEVPLEFKTNLPDIYNHLCFLLNQDPLQTNNDYHLSASFIQEINSDSSRHPIPLSIRKNYKYHDSHWSFSIILIGLFVALPVIIYLHGKVLFKPLHIVMIITGCSAIVSGFRNYFFDKGIYEYVHLILFSSAGLGLVLSSLILISNKYVILQHQQKSVAIEQYIFVPSYDRQHDEYLLFLEGDAYKNYPSLRTFNRSLVTNKMQFADSVQFTFSTGLWGFENYESKKLIINASKELNHSH